MSRRWSTAERQLVWHECAYYPDNIDIMHLQRQLPHRTRNAIVSYISRMRQQLKRKAIFIHWLWESPCGVIFGANTDLTNTFGAKHEGRMIPFNVFGNNNIVLDFIDEMNEVKNCNVLCELRMTLVEYIESKILARKEKEMTGNIIFYTLICL